MPAFLRPGLMKMLVTSSRQEVEAQMGCLYYTVVQIGAAALYAWRFPRRLCVGLARWPSDVGRWLLRDALPVDDAVGSWNVSLF